MTPKGYLKFSEETRADFIHLFERKAIQELITKTKTASDDDSGSFKVCISSDDEDRQGEKVNQAGLDFTFFLTSPVVLWGHNYSEPPVGICTRIWREGNKTMGEGKWAPTAFAQELRKLYDLGMLRAVSIGFIPKELDEDGNTVKGEVLEFSFVSVPANPFALSLDTFKQINLSPELLAVKGLSFEFGGKDADKMQELQSLIKELAVEGITVKFKQNKK